ncbi:DNA-processing protein DprA [Nocardioides caldifontis]|uniref:DNA-processing protein DprA n=1 Tax=Nocardioides caldifontis TaxID=2588938 RepID=UPI0011E011BA|nr:DNA-processing protein DprA [Nocardioides caldifontis]
MTAATDEERLARAALNLVSEPGDPRVARLVAALGAVEVHDRLLADTDLEGLRSDAAERLAGVAPGRVLDDARRRGIRFVVPGDDEWPEQLADLDLVEPLNRLAGAPLGLWLRGPLRLRDACETAVAVVGSRSATTYGTDVAADLSARLARHRVTVVSGAAFGIDYAAHRGAIGGGGPTVAVLACGVDRAYPTAHRALLDHLAEVGLVVSELPPGCSPTRVRFLGRNRLIAALSTGTVVVEAAVRSGALNTATWATRLNRLLMGVPGPATSAPSEGVHELVRSGAASLVTRGEHVLELVAPVGEQLFPVQRAPVRPRDLLAHDELRVLDAVPLVRPAPTTAVARTAGLSVGTVTASLERLRAAGWVDGAEGRWRRSGRRLD